MSPRTVRHWAETGQLRGFRFPMRMWWFTEEAYAQFVAKRRRQGREMVA